MKVIFICSTTYLIYLMRCQAPICQTYDKAADCFPYKMYFIPLCFLLAIVTCDSITNPINVLWAFSIWMESVAIFPQLYLLQRLREVENLTSHYVVAMGLYRFFYILNWIYRYYDKHYTLPIGWIGGIIQTALYCDFFYCYAVSKWYGQKLVLPFAQEV